MVNIIKRMRKLRSLLWIRNGPGAIQLPKEVTKISLEFHTKLIGRDHRGPRHFWHEMLPRIKYRNPALPISVTRHTDPTGPAYLHIYTSNQKPNPTYATDSMQSSSPSDTPTPPTSDTSDITPSHTIDIKSLHESEILEQLIEKTGAIVLQPPPEEVQELAELEDFEERSEKDRVEVREKLMKVRREEELLRLARGEVPNAA